MGTTPRSQLQFDKTTNVVTEDKKKIVLSIIRSDSLQKEVSVEYFTKDGTANAGIDYETNRGRLNFSEGEKEKAITINIIDDKAVDGNKKFTVHLTNPTGGNLGSPQKTNVIIADNDIGSAFKAIGTGHNYSFAVTETGNVWGWGNNEHGQLGDGTTENHLVPTLLPLLEDVVAIDGGNSHAVALKSDATVWAWGTGAATGNETGSMIQPAQVQGIDNVIAVAAGQGFSVALKKDGTVWAWGRNFNGQLGNGSNQTTHTPTQVSKLENIVSIDTGASHTLALSQNGSVWVWGENSCGQIGDGTFDDHLTPYRIPTFTAKSITAGHLSNATLASDDQVWFWGNWGSSNDEAIASDCDFSDIDDPKATTPQRISFEDFDSIEAENATLYGIKSDGKIYQWGFGYSSEIPELQDIELISGELHALFADNKGQLFSLGSNDSGQLGDGSTDSEYSNPTQVLLGNSEPEPEPEPEPIKISSGGSLPTNKIGTNNSEELMHIMQLEIPTDDTTISSFTVKGSESGHEANDIALVRVYYDANDNKAIDSSDPLITQGKFQQDNGRIKFKLDNPYSLKSGRHFLLFEYLFK